MKASVTATQDVLLADFSKEDNLTSGSTYRDQLFAQKSGTEDWPEELISTVECIGPEINRTCLFKNLYFDVRGGWVIFVTKQPTSDLELRLTNKYYSIWRPQVVVVKSKAALENYTKNNWRRVEQYKGLTAFFQSMWHFNIGHALFDALYPTFVALAKFGRQDDIFRALVKVEQDCYEDKKGDPAPGDLVEAYLPDASRESGHTWHAEQVVLVKVADRKFLPICDFHNHQDDSGQDLRKVVFTVRTEKQDMQARCCRACAQHPLCQVAVLLDVECYLKGACDKGRGKCGYYRLGDQVACILRPDPAAAAAGQVIVRRPSNSQEIPLPFDWMLGLVRHRCMAEGIFEKFAGFTGGLYRLYELQRDAEQDAGTTLVQFEEVIVGIGRVGNLIMHPTGAVGGSLAPLHATARYRDRMMWSYGIFGRHVSESGAPVNAIVVMNRRYSVSDQRAIRNTIAHLNGLANVSAEFIDWRAVGGGTFAAQMRLINRTNIYMSSPGTALMYVPFMWAGGVFVNLGHVHELYGRKFPSYMEQQLAGGGTPYLRTLYMDPRELMRNPGHPGFVHEGPLLRLAQQAVDIARSGFSIPVAVKDNLSVEGRIVLELCDADPETCQVMFRERNDMGGPWQCVVDMWPECIVYELGGWSEEGWQGQNCTLNRTELRKLRKRHNLPGFGAPED